MPDAEKIQINITASSASAIDNVKKLNAELDGIKARVKEIGKISIPAFNVNIPKDVGARVTALAEAVTKAKQTLSKGLNFKFKFIPDDILSKLPALTSSLDKFGEAYERAREISQKGGIKAQVSGVKNVTSDIEEKVGRIRTSTAKNVPAGVSNVGKVFDGLSKKVDVFNRKLLSGPVKLVGGIFGRIGGIALNPFKGIANDIKDTQKRLSGLFGSLKRVAVYRAIRTVLKELSQGFAEGKENLYQYSAVAGTDFKRSMDSLATSSLYMKNSIATIAEPLINAIAPAVDLLSDKFAELSATVAEFVAALTGQATYSKAIKFPIQYADAANSAAKAAQKWLGPFDEINRLAANYGGAAGSSLDYSSMFETVEVTGEGWATKIWAKLKEAWENADFSDIGGAISRKIKAGLDGIDWESIKASARRIGSSIGTFITGFFTEPGFAESIGSTIANSINTVFEFSGSLRSKIDFAGIGRALGNGLNRLLNGANFFRYIGEIKGWADGMISFLTSSIKTTDFKALGEKIGNAIKDQDWFVTFSGIADLGISIIGGLGDALSSFVDSGAVSQFFGDLGKSIGQTLSDKKFWTNAFKTAKGLGSAFFEGLGAALSGAAGGLLGIDVNTTQDENKAIGGAVVGIGALIKLLPTLTGLFGSKNKILSKQTDLTNAETGAVGLLAKAFGTSSNVGLWKSSLGAVAGLGVLFEVLTENGRTVDRENEKFQRSKQALEGVGVAAQATADKFQSIREGGQISGFSLDVQSALDAAKTKGISAMTQLRDGIAQKLTPFFEKSSQVTRHFGEVFSGNLTEAGRVAKGNLTQYMSAADSNLALSFNNILKNAKYTQEQISRVGKVGLAIAGGGLGGMAISNGGLGSAFRGNWLGLVDARLMANGGYLDKGEAYIARENGPELVGMIGRRNAVANNQQIISGIRSGVADANDNVVRALYAIAAMLADTIQSTKANNGKVNWTTVARKISVVQARQAASANV